MREHLSYYEMLATGLNLGIYDFDMINHLPGGSYQILETICPGSRVVVASTISRRFTRNCRYS
jgi:hypothetical protein